MENDSFKILFGNCRIEYDINKEMKNISKHRYSLESAVFHFEKLILPVPSEGFLTYELTRKGQETRHKHISKDDEGNITVIITTMRDNNVIRIISYRRANKNEISLYNYYIKN